MAGVTATPPTPAGEANKCTGWARIVSELGLSAQRAGQPAFWRRTSGRALERRIVRKDGGRSVRDVNGREGAVLGNRSDGRTTTPHQPDSLFALPTPTRLTTREHTNARFHHRGSKFDPRSDLRSAQNIFFAPFEFRARLEMEMKFISNRRNWRFEISIRDQQPSSTNLQTGKIREFNDLQARLYKLAYKYADINCTLVVCCHSGRRGLDTILQEVLRIVSPWSFGAQVVCAHAAVYFPLAEGTRDVSEIAEVQSRFGAQAAYALAIHTVFQRLDRSQVRVVCDWFLTKGRRVCKWEITEKTHRPAASSGTIPTREYVCVKPAFQLVAFHLGEPGSIPGFSLARGNRAARYCWSAGFLGDLPFPQPVHSGASPYSPRFTLIDSQDLDAKRRRNLSNPLLRISLWLPDSTYCTHIRKFSPLVSCPACMERSYLVWGPMVDERLARSPPTKANRVQSPVGSPVFRKWESCRIGRRVFSAPLHTQEIREFNDLQARLYSVMYKYADINSTLVVCCHSGRRQLDTVLQEVSNTVKINGKIRSGVQVSVARTTKVLPPLGYCSSPAGLHPSVVAALQPSFSPPPPSVPGFTPFIIPPPLHRLLHACVRTRVAVPYASPPADVCAPAYRSYRAATTIPARAPTIPARRLSHATVANNGSGRRRPINRGGEGGRSPRKPADRRASSCTIPTCEDPKATPPVNEPGSPRWEASSLTTTPPRPLQVLCGPSMSASQQCSRVIQAPSCTVGFTRWVKRPLVHSNREHLVRSRSKSLRARTQLDGLRQRLLTAGPWQQISCRIPSPRIFCNSRAAPSVLMPRLLVRLLQVSAFSAERRGGPETPASFAAVWYSWASQKATNRAASASFQGQGRVELPPSPST
ncbi:hypothetical protein PR048_014012 [Dryococelus australis]|uniref:Uncharacterized protein n=1 Tax=Dryococelus australis TaxID=614101 RepID=A0ABQ9HTU1_9NEOP|nr:hypothetical protein PR048_014012 [Dryococelus australis]